MGGVCCKIRRVTMKKSRVIHLLFLGLTVVCYFSLGIINVNATTITWHSDFGSSGLIASFTTTTDITVTDFNVPIEITESQYTFMLGDHTHTPTQGIGRRWSGSGGCSIFITDYYYFSGWYWSGTDWTYDFISTGFNLEFEAMDYPNGVVEINHQSDPITWHFFDASIIYAYTVESGYIANPIWGDNTLHMPVGGTDWGQWEITGITTPALPPIPPQPTPEPTTMLLLGLGLVGLAGVRRKFTN